MLKFSFYIMKGILKSLFSKIKSSSTGDLVKLPNKSGLIIFPISMGKITGEQSAEKVFNFIKNKVLEKLWDNSEPISILILYSESFYKKYNMGHPNHLKLIKEHETKLKSLIKSVSYLEDSAYSFYNWDEFINKFGNYYEIEKGRDYLLKLSELDDVFGKYLSETITRLNQVDCLDSRKFLLEETVLFHYLLKEHINYTDDFVKNRNKWVLIAYSGFALKIIAYVHKHNVFKLDGNSKNVFQDTFYDFKSGYLYQYNNLDLDKYKSLDSYATLAKESEHR